MSILVGVGSSQNPDSIRALDQALQSTAESLQGHQPSFLLALISPTTYDQESIVKELSTRLPDTVVVGCSTSGEIINHESKDKSIALMAIYSDQMKFIAGIGNNIKDDARKAGQQLAQDIRNQADGEQPRAALILPDGLTGNGADIVRGILDEFGQDFMVVGGSAGDDFEFKQTYQFYNGQVLSGSVVGVGLYGDFHFGVGVKHGWIPIGNPRTVTKAESNVLYELDGKPAIEIYQDQFGKDKTVISHDEPFARLAITYPLGIMLPDSEEYLIRDPITVDEQGAITCAAEVPEGSEVYIMIGSREEAIAAAKEVAQNAITQLGEQSPKAAFLFNCIARKKLLMTKKQAELDEVAGVIGSDTPIIGFYTYGEQAPLGGEVVTCSFHNETDVLFLLAE